MLYFGEANVCHENFDSFLSIAQDLRLKGLTDQYLRELLKEQETLTNPTPTMETKEPAIHFDTKQSEGPDKFSNKVSTIVSNLNQVKSDPEALAQTV